MSRKKKNRPEKTWPTESLRAEVAAITVAKRACDWATEVTWTVSYTACLRRKPLEKGRELTLEQLQNTTRSMEASDRQAGAIENPNDKEGLKEGLNSVYEKT